jgi:anti-sigma-K factor RskA
MNGTPHDPARLSPQALEALEETLAAYALGALPDSEAAAVARHLATCAACRAVTADLGATVGLLAVTPTPVAPSADLKQRLLAAAQAEQATGEPASARIPPTTGDSAAAPVAPIALPDAAARAARPGTARRAVDWFPWLATAAALLISLSVGVWNAQLRGELREQSAESELIHAARQSWALTPTPDGSSGRGLLMEPETGGPPVLLLQDLPRQPPNRTYQVWVIRDGQPASAAVLRPAAEGQQVVQLQQGLSGVDTVAVSVEPAGGSPNPTGPIVLAGNL